MQSASQTTNSACVTKIAFKDQEPTNKTKQHNIIFSKFWIMEWIMSFDPVPYNFNFIVGTRSISVVLSD
jgi:hypothetical protein